MDLFGSFCPFVPSNLLVVSNLPFPLNWLFFSVTLSKATEKAAATQETKRVTSSRPAAYVRHHGDVTVHSQRGEGLWRAPDRFQTEHGSRDVRLHKKKTQKTKKPKKKTQIGSGVAIRDRIRQRQQRRARGVASSEPQPAINDPSCLFLAHRTNRTHLTLILCCSACPPDQTGTISFHTWTRTSFPSCQKKVKVQQIHQTSN